MDLFANLSNATLPLFCLRQNSAFFYDWSLLSADGQKGLWAKPPWSQLLRVVTKACLNPCKIVLATPLWKEEPWFEVLKEISLKTIVLYSNLTLYLTDQKQLLPATSWQTQLTLIDITKKGATLDKLDSQTIRRGLKTNQGWGRDHLEQEMSTNPKLVPPQSIQAIEK